MIRVDIDSKLYKIIRDKYKSTKTKFKNIVDEMKEVPKEGNYYKSYDGKRLLEVETKYKITEFEVHSIKLEDRLRLVYEYHNLECIDDNDNTYSGHITITDIGNHTYKGEPYVKIYSE